ncbi:hypothetical protein D9M72_597910 [compost metagenome]
MAAGEDRTLVALHSNSRTRPGLGAQGRPCVVGLLRVLLLVLAWPGGGINPCPRGGGCLHLGGVVSLRPYGQFQLIALRIRDACVPGFQCRGNRPDYCHKDEGRQHNYEYIAHG